MGQAKVDNRGIWFTSKDVMMKVEDDKIKDKGIRDNIIENKIVGVELTVQSS
jgi:hypothetical protein